MKKLIGVYDNHEVAMNAVSELKSAGYPVHHISILGITETENMDDNMDIHPEYPIRGKALAAGTLVLSTTLGSVAGIGLFAVPGIGFLYGAGAIVGAIAGFDFGLIGGGLVSIISTLGLRNGFTKKYHDDLVNGKFLLIAHGTNDQVSEALTILRTHAAYDTLHAHDTLPGEEPSKRLAAFHLVES